MIHVYDVWLKKMALHNSHILPPFLNICLFRDFKWTATYGCIYDAGVTVGGGEEDPRPLETAPRVLLRCDGRFRRWSSSAKVYGDEAEA